MTSDGEVLILMDKESQHMLGNADGSTATSSVDLRNKHRKSATITAFAFIVLFALQTTVQQLINGNNKDFHGSNNPSLNIDPKSRKYDWRWQTSARNISLDQDYYAGYSIRDAIKIEYEQWHKLVRNLSQMELPNSNWRPGVDWNNHPKERSARFPEIHERVQYYMGEWYNSTIPMYGRDFEQATFIQRKSTREYGPFSDILVNLYNLDKSALLKCYRNKKELHVFSPYCRDYIDIAILSSEGTANVLHNVGDCLPYVPDEIRKYPIFAKVRPLCNHGVIDPGGGSFVNKLCQRTKSVEPIILPLNRKRHYGAASRVPENDIPWEKKKTVAVWRGHYGKHHDTLSDTNDIKYALVSKHLNSTLVDAKFSKHTKDAPQHMVASYMDINEQLRYKYIISVEGNDVSSGLKWMLFSNSVVLAPQFTWESWAMEGKLKPFQHYIPLKADMSNTEEMIQWAETHPEETKLISERSTLFMYDLLFHPDAMEDEKQIMINIMERFEQNFGSPAVEQNNALTRDADRALRFPSVDERVRYAMGKWYNKNETISMKRSETNNMPRLVSHDISTKDPRSGCFVASGYHLSTCAMTNSSTYSNDIRMLCLSSLPEFDERLTADLKSNSYNRLLKTRKGESMKLAKTSSWRLDTKGMKESKRVLLDDSIKVLCHGGRSRNRVNIPFFARVRKIGGDAILWPFSIDDSVDMVKSGWIQSIDREFKDKRPSIWRDELGSSPKNAALTSSELVSSNIDAARDDKDGMSKNFFSFDEATERKHLIREMLSHRYLLVEEDDDGNSSDLLWMLLSQSVVIMPAERRITSWILEGFLLPFTHFVPVASDYSDIDEKIEWCEDHVDEVKRISERATLFVHDLLLDWRADKDNEEVKFQVMERYSMLFG